MKHLRPITAAKQQGITLVALIFLLLILSIFSAALFFSTTGWGHVGYYGYHRPGSSFYWGGPTMHYGSSSVRNGSINGARHIGGGPGRGK